MLLILYQKKLFTATLRDNPVLNLQRTKTEMAFGTCPLKGGPYSKCRHFLRSSLAKYGGSTNHKPSQQKLYTSPVLTRLELTNFAIVDSLKLDLSPGLNVLTGETGAGKSILIDALSILIGGRAETSWIRTGADSSLIQGLFSDDIESAARRISSSGRNTARLEGELVSVSELAERLGNLVVIHGQHASHTLQSSSEQRKLLDRLLTDKDQNKLSKYRETYTTYQRVRKELEELREATRERARRIDILQFQVAEINAAKLKTNEIEVLKGNLETLRFAEKITNNASKAVNLLNSADINAVELIAEAAKDLELAGRYNKTVESLANDLREALSSVSAVADEVESFLSEFEADPSGLEKLENRMAMIETLQRKYGESIETIVKYRDEAQTELDLLTNADANMEALEKEQAELLESLKTLADELSSARRKVAKKLSDAVTKEIKPLGMTNAVFQVAIEKSDALTSHGRDDIIFLFSANLGEEPAPLSNVASGGELSRVMLGLNVVTGSDVPILAFDEVDAGIGGKTARAVGALLKQLAKDHQVLVVTHLPQVAAFADAQFYVEKREVDKRTVTRVMRLEPHERELELARMLSGSASDAAIANARELIAEAQGV
jgi:DNA repair protein RecN (Recombination protein N)